MKLTKELIELKVEILKKLVDYLFEDLKSLPLDMEIICNHLGIKLVPFEGARQSYIEMAQKDPEFSGFGGGGLAYSTWVNSNEPEIWFNKYLTPQWKRIHLAHELGHIIDMTEKQHTIDSLTKIDFRYESRAIRFASELTLPISHCLMLLNKGSFRQIMNIYDIPPFTIITKIMMLLRGLAVCYVIDEYGDLFFIWATVPKIRFSQRFYLEAIKSLEDKMKKLGQGIPYILLDVDSKFCFALEPETKHLEGLDSFKILPLVKEAFSKGLGVAEWAKRGKLQWVLDFNKEKRYEVMSDSPYWFASVYPLEMPEMFSLTKHKIAIVFLIEDPDKELISLWEEKKQGLLSDRVCKEILKPFKEWKNKGDFATAMWVRYITKAFID